MKIRAGEQLRKEAARLGRWGDKPTIERFEEKFIPEPMSGCWLWMGAHNTYWYGQIWDPVKKKIVLCTHWIYEYTFGHPVPSGLYACHKCDNPHCVNPRHLFIGGSSANMLDASAKKRIRNSAKDRCLRGHMFDEENTIIRSNKRRGCRMCKAIRASKFYLDALRAAKAGEVKADG